MEAAEFSIRGRMSALEAHTHLTVISVGPVTVDVAIAVAIAVAVARAAVTGSAVALSTAPLALCGLSESTGPST